MSYKVIPAFVLFCLIPLSSPAKGDVLSKYVYMIRIPDSKTAKTTLQTGFRLAGTKGIITALHGVAPGTTFSAYNEENDVLVDLTIASVDIKRDLALLRSDELEKREADGLQAVGSINLSPEEALRAFGHPLGINLYIKNIKAGTPVKKELHELIPPDSAEGFDLRQSPATDITVLSIEGSLVPGDSGAPVLNSDNKVVGVVNGGLLTGAAFISWAIPIPDVQWRSIVSARTRVNEIAKLNTDVLFARTLDTSAGPPNVRCFDKSISLSRPVFSRSAIGQTFDWENIEGEDPIAATQGDLVQIRAETTGGKEFGKITYSCEATGGKIRAKDNSCILDTSSISSAIELKVQVNAVSEQGHCTAGNSVTVKVTPLVDAFRLVLLDLVASSRVRFGTIAKDCTRVDEEDESCGATIFLPNSKGGSINRHKDSKIRTLRWSEYVTAMKLRDDKNSTTSEADYDNLVKMIKVALPSGWKFTDDIPKDDVLKSIDADSPDMNTHITVSYGISNITFGKDKGTSRYWMNFRIWLSE